MDLVVVLKAVMVAILALFMLYILSLMLNVVRGDSPKPKRAPVKRRCEGTRQKKTCGKLLYRCVNCAEEGCQMKDCDNRCFEPPATCLRCGFTGVMEPV